MFLDADKQARRTLRQLLDADDHLIVAAGAWDGASAALAESVGLEALFIGGMQIAAGAGLPDAEFYTKTQAQETIRNVSSRSTAALVVDMDTGFGSASHTFHTLRAYENAGASAVMIEDQTSPKQACHWLVEGGSLVDVEYAASKVRAAADARQSEDTIIIARTDAEGDEIFRRAEAYAAAGADMICAISTSPDFGPASWKRLSETVELPLVSTPIPGTWQEREFTPEVLSEIGVRVVAAGLQPFNAAMGAVRRVYEQIKAGAPMDSLGEGAMSIQEVMTLMGLYEAIDLESKYTAEIAPSVQA